MDATLAALAEPTRRRLVDLLRGGPRRAGELAAALRMTPPATSRHLRVLRASGLVDVTWSDDDARLRMYRLRREPFVALQAWLDQLDAFWGEQLGSFKKVAEDPGGADGGERG
ncbi:MAG TPA: metalloregulator ArsR/SmtB family transcription factor [Pseudonocardiaceae bacterium]